MYVMEELSRRDELAQIYSDFHKDMYGFRPRHAGDWTEEQLKAEIDSMHASLKKQEETFEGREQMREDGWWAEETDPVLQQRAVWLAQERDRQKAEYYGDDWRDHMAEAPKMRKRWSME